MIRKLFYALRVERGLRLVWESSRYWIVCSILLTVFISLQPALALYLQKLLFDYLAQGLIDKTSVTVATLIGLVIAMAATEIIGILLRSLSGYVTTAQGQSAQDHVMAKLHRKSAELDLSFYETPEYFDNLHLAQVEAPKRTARFVDVITQIAQNSLSLVAVLALLVTYHWAIAGLLLVAVLPGLFVNLKSAGKLYRWRSKSTAREREANYYHGLITNAAGAKEARVFGYGPVIAQWFAKLRQQLRAELCKIVRVEQTRAFIVGASSTAGLYFGFFFFAREAFNGNFTMGDIALFYNAFHRAQGFLRSVVVGISALYESNLFLNNLFQVLAIKPQVVTPANPIVLPSEPPIIELRNVGFSYPGTGRRAIHDISFRIEPGEHIAIVGKNGSGKSTLVKLLCRLYDRSEGEITLNGSDIRSYELEQYRSNFSVLFQDYMQFDLSVRKNIWLGKVDGDDSDAAIAEAAILSGADPVAKSLPFGYDTTLGKVLKEGEQLSQGEWQKIALARALFRKANITILDEPTSWMDPEAEYQFFEKFHQLAAGRAAIMISHRLNTVRMANRIIVLECGRILEMGTHDELIARRGRYSSLFETQATNYR